MQKSKFLGVYSRRNVAALRSSGKNRLYFVWKLSSDGYAIQELDKAFLPKSDVVKIPDDLFKASFVLEPAILAMPVETPDLSILEKKGEPEENARPAPPKDRKISRARQLENDMRSNFRKALSALVRPRERQGALAALEQLVRLKRGILPEHKHMFRDFGVSLRKKNLINLALESAARVLEFSPDDDHAHFNIARIYALQGAHSKAIAHLERAINLNGDEPCYHRLLAHIRRDAKIR